MPLGAAKAALLGAAGGGEISYDPAYTWISDVVMADSTTATLTFDSLPTDYHALHLVGNYNTTAGTYLLANVSSTVTGYCSGGYEIGPSSAGLGPYKVNYASASTNFAYVGGYGSSTTNINEKGGCFLEMWLPGYTNTDKPKACYVKTAAHGTGAWYQNIQGEQVFRNLIDTAIDEINIWFGSGYFYEGSAFSLYGVGTASG